MIINDSFININKYLAKENKNDTTLVFTHGLAEYSKSYIEIATFFQEKGFNVITYDLRGHGKSFGKRGDIESYQEYLDDLNEIVIMAKKLSSKVFLVGHSMGGIITNLYTSLNNNVNGVIISSSPTDYLDRVKSMRYLPKFLVNNKRLKTSFNDPKLTANLNYVKDAYDLDYVYIRITTEVLVRAIKKLKRNYKNYTTPALFLYSKKDELVNYTNGEYIMSMIKSEDKELILYENSNHNIFIDIEKEQIYFDILKWLNDRI